MLLSKQQVSVGYGVPIQFSCMKDSSGLTVNLMDTVDILMGHLSILVTGKMESRTELDHIRL